MLIILNYDIFFFFTMKWYFYGNYFPLLKPVIHTKIYIMISIGFCYMIVRFSVLMIFYLMKDIGLWYIFFFPSFVQIVCLFCSFYMDRRALLSLLFTLRRLVLSILLSLTGGTVLSILLIWAGGAVLYLYHIFIR